MVDLEQYPDTAILKTSEAVKWLDLANGRALVSIGVEPLTLRGREYLWLAGELKRAILGLPIPPRAESTKPTRVLTLQRATS